MTLRLSEKEFAERFPEQAYGLRPRIQETFLSDEERIADMIRIGEALPDAPKQRSGKKTFMLYVLVFVLGYMAAEIRYVLSVFFLF